MQKWCLIVSIPDYGRPSSSTDPEFKIVIAQGHSVVKWVCMSMRSRTFSSCWSVVVCHRMPWRWPEALTCKCWHSDMLWACGGTSGSSWSMLLQCRQKDVLCATRSAAVERRETNGVFAALCAEDGCISPAQVSPSSRSTAMFVSYVPHSMNRQKWSYSHWLSTWVK